MSLTIASWNIEKNGQSSTLDKQVKVNHFIDSCVEINIPIIFLCEVHSARVDDYKTYLSTLYKGYNVDSLPGGYSNAYVILTRKNLSIEISHSNLKGLNREAILIQIDDFSLILTHFKSGQTNLTKDQLVNASLFLEEISSGRWAIIGDMNWDYSRYNELFNNFKTFAYSCWSDQTQKHGGILDWCLTGQFIKGTPFDLTTFFSKEIYDMQGPDHKPVIFILE